MATSDVESFLRREGILLTIYYHHAVTLTTVHYTQLAIIEKILILDTWINIKSQITEILQFQGFSYRHGATKDESVVMRVGQVYLISNHHLLHHKALAQSLRIVMLNIFRMASSLKVHILLRHSTLYDHHQGHRKKRFLHFINSLSYSIIYFCTDLHCFLC